MSSICLAFRLGWLLGLENRLTPSCWTSNDCVGYDVPNPATPGKPLPIIWILGRALTPRLKCQHTRLRPDSIQPSDFRRLLARAHILQTPLATSHVSLRGRSHQSPKAVHNRSTRGDFSTTSSLWACTVWDSGRKRRDQRWFTTTPPTQTSHTSGFVGEFARLGPALSSNHHGFLIRLVENNESFLQNTPAFLSEFFQFILEDKPSEKQAEKWKKKSFG